MVALAAAGASAAAGIAGSAISAGAAGSAADKQAAAARQAAQMQQDQYQQTRSDLQPYNLAGQSTLGSLTGFYDQSQPGVEAAYANLANNVPGQMTQAQLEATPGYQFNLSQGLKSVQNSAAARGLGVSGAALKASATYATGLADSTYQNQYNNAQTRFADYNSILGSRINANNAGYNYLSNTAALGENAAAKAGFVGQAGAAAAGQNLANAGVAQAAGITQAGQAMSNGLQSIGNAPLNYLAYKNLAASSDANAASGGFGNAIAATGGGFGSGPPGNYN